jgi:hypothetical protein
MAEEPRPRRTPGGYVPPDIARARPPEGNGHAPHRPLGMLRSTWSDVDAEDEQTLQAERTKFERVADLDPGIEVRASARPSIAVIAGVLVVVALVVVAVLLYRMAPP